jgi:hypothetical protein
MRSTRTAIHSKTRYGKKSAIVTWKQITLTRSVFAVEDIVLQDDVGLLSARTYIIN